MYKLDRKWMLATVSGLLVMSLSACSKKDESVTHLEQSNSEAMTNVESKQADDKTDVASLLKLPQPDKAITLEQYEAVTSGEMLMYSYYGLSKMPLDVNEIATKLSSDFRQTQDQFKKQDILKVLEPQIKEKVAAHSQNRYFSWDFNDSASNLIDHYDFQRKVFPIKNSYWDGGYSYYWNDVMDYKISFKAPQPLQGFKVEDEATARQIEQLLTEHGRNAKLTVYCFAQEFDLNEKKINTLVTSFILRDSKGNILAKQTM